MVLASATLTTAAHAAVMVAAPPVEYEIRIGGATLNPTDAGTFTSATATATTIASPLPTLKTTIAVGDFQDDVNIFMRYYFRVNGPASVVVPISLSGIIKLAAAAPDTGQANAYGQIDLATSFNSPVAALAISRGGSVSGAVLETAPTLTADAYTNSWYSITLRAGVVARGSKDGGASGSAFVDPYLSIDPAFFSSSNPSSLYSLSFSDGIGNAALGAVPEPATWGLMILGFGAVGGAMRARRAGARALA